MLKVVHLLWDDALQRYLHNIQLHELYLQPFRLLLRWIALRLKIQVFFRPDSALLLQKKGEFGYLVHKKVLPAFSHLPRENTSLDSLLFALPNPEHPVSLYL